MDLPVTMKNWGEQNGYSVAGDAVVKEVGGYLFSCALHFNMGYCLCVPLEGMSWQSQYLKTLKRQLKGLGRLSYNKGILQLQVKASSLNMKKTYSRMEQAMDILAGALPELGVQPLGRCFYCNGSDFEDYVVENNIAYPVHSHCKQQQAERIYHEVMTNEEEGNYGLAVLCAIIGGIVGSLPSLLTIYMLELVSAWLFMLIPMAAYFSYRKGKGIMNRMVPIIVTVVSLLCTFVLVLMMEYIYIVEEFGIVGLGDYFEFVFHPEIFGYVLLDGVMPFLFCIIGVAFSWRHISRTNKQKLQRAEELRRNAAQVPTDMH